MATATDLTREHYQRPEVREILTKFALMQGDTWRALNGDFHRWYKNDGKGNARLLNIIDDYDDIINVYRTLYQTLNVFEPGLRSVIRPKEAITSDNPLGTPADTVAYTLGVDIDKGPGCDIEDPLVKQAVEDAAAFLINRLQVHGIHESVWSLFSGGGIYVLIHHGICKPNSAAPEDRKAFFEELTDRYNRFIEHTSDEFFELHPEHKGKVKYDALNNSKRIFKCILAIHKKKPYAVTPLNLEQGGVDFERARVPLKDDMIAEARKWYSTYNPAEHEPLLKLLDGFKEAEEERKSKHLFKEIWRSVFKVDTKYFPHCIKHIIDTANHGEGKTRFTAVLSTVLYQLGWDEEEAWALVKSVSDRNGLDNADHIFDSCYGRISCPSCKTIQTDATGYPHLGLKWLGACREEEECDRWPGDYATAYALGDVQAEAKKNGLKADGPTVLDAFALILQHEAEALEDSKFDKWEWRLQKRRIERTLKSGFLTIKGEEKAHKFLGKYKIFLKKFNMDYENLYPIPRKEKSKKEEFDWRVKAKAWKVLRRGDPLQYIADGCGRVVLGAETAFKKLTCCISAQNVNQTAGMHPKFSGESSGGKTITVYCFAHHMPVEMVIKGSMSSKAGFYHNDGDRVLRILDDYQAGNEDLDTVIKQTSSEFHEPYIHRTVANHQAVKLKIGREQTWAITSVDSSQDIQVLNRQLPINVDDSTELTKRVNNKTVERYAKGEVQQPIDKSVLVSRAIFQILRDEGYINVRIPFGDRIEWLDTSNRRNPSIFLDLMISITAMNRYQREQDKEGYYLATEEDFKTAKALFTDKDAEELVKRLTARERDIIELLIRQSGGLTRDEIAAELKIAPDRVSQIIGGQRNSGGLRQKVQLAETKESISTRTGNKETDDTRKTTFKTVYSLKDYNRFTGFDAVVRLKPVSSNPPMCAMYELCKVLCIQNDMCKPELCKICIREIDRVDRDREGSRNIAEHFYHEIQEKAKLHSSEATDSESPYIALQRAYIAYIVGLAVNDSKDEIKDPSYVSPKTGYVPIGEEIRRAEERAQQKEEHFKTPGLKAIYKPKGEALEYSGLALNLYTGCSLGCIYCYNKDRFKGPYDKPRQAASLVAIAQDLDTLKNDRIPVHISFVGNPYDKGRANDYTREVLQLFRKHNHPFQVLTKGGMLAAKDFDLYGTDDIFGVTLTFTNEEDSKKHEPNAAMPVERIEALKTAKAHGLKTWVSLEPVIDPAQSLQAIELTHEYVDFYGVGKLNHNAELEKSIDWHKFRADAEALLKKYNKQYKIKQALANATSSPKKPDPDAPHKLRLLKEWRTNVPRPNVLNAWDDKLYPAGEIVEVPIWKVKDLIAKGIAEEASS